jgi:excisionase family DNA binding protein
MATQLTHLEAARRQAQSTASIRAMRVNDFCKRYAVGRSTVYALIRSGKLPDGMIAGRRIIPVDDAERLLKPEEVC